MITKVLKITTGGLIILGGYIFAYKYGYVKGLLDLKMAFDEDDRKRRERKKVSYSHYYSSSGSREDLYILSSREEAEEVLATLHDILEKYGQVTVVDYKELVGVSSSYTENKRGWTDLSDAHVERTFDGWVVVLSDYKDLD